MDDHLRPGLGDRVPDLVGVQRIGHHRGRPQVLERCALRVAAGHADDLMPRLDQPRHELLTHRSRCACKKDPHDRLLSSILCPF